GGATLSSARRPARSQIATLSAALRRGEDTAALPIWKSLLANAHLSGSGPQRFAARLKPVAALSEFELSPIESRRLFCHQAQACSDRPRRAHTAISAKNRPKTRCRICESA